ncbi:unnamed protein product [Notodromas monacha]|uniref:Ig-like domain-containing protein n=1 Tax=Notodromas monacha TaxID=399045 RepID=A0A7R9BCC6_9CRUS|nr:unnamed protein product [Notodromas monacha]CAG0912624.1 unnamed protein product [Notodromas monacha]
MEPPSERRRCWRVVNLDGLCQAMVAIFIFWSTKNSGSVALKLRQLNVPDYAITGETATLECNYDLGREALYVVKWFKDTEEFYRYMPGIAKATQTFNLPGVQVDVASSNDKRVVLRNISLKSAGKYRCEVSADAPSFHTIRESAPMRVYDLPDSDPVLSGTGAGGMRYTISKYEWIIFNCTSHGSYPAANLTWQVNGKPSVRRDDLQVSCLRGSSGMVVKLGPRGGDEGAGHDQHIQFTLNENTGPINPGMTSRRPQPTVVTSRKVMRRAPAGPAADEIIFPSEPVQHVEPRVHLKGISRVARVMGGFPAHQRQTSNDESRLPSGESVSEENFAPALPASHAVILMRVDSTMSVSDFPIVQEKTGTFTTIKQLKFSAQPQHVKDGEIKIKCISRISAPGSANLYYKSQVKTLLAPSELKRSNAVLNGNSPRKPWDVLRRLVGGQGKNFTRGPEASEGIKTAVKPGRRDRRGGKKRETSSEVANFDASCPWASVPCFETGFRSDEIFHSAVGESADGLFYSVEETNSDNGDVELNAPWACILSTEVDSERRRV